MKSMYDVCSAVTGEVKVMKGEEIKYVHGRTMIANNHLYSILYKKLGVIYVMDSLDEEE